MPIEVWELESEDITSVGGPMHLVNPTTNWKRYFTSKGAAKLAAEMDYRSMFTQRPSQMRLLRWSGNGKKIRTNDLGFVMYHVRRLHVEDD